MQNILQSMGLSNHKYSFMVISNFADAGGLDLARRLNIPSQFIPNEHFEERFISFAESYEPDVICLAGFMKILSKSFVNRFRNKILNIHPSLLPKYKGLKVHERVVFAKEKETGCTVHIVDEKVDNGRILGQAVVEISQTDNALSVSKKVLKREHELYPIILKRFLKGKTNFIKI